MSAFGRDMGKSRCAADARSPNDECPDNDGRQDHDDTDDDEPMRAEGPWARQLALLEIALLALVLFALFFVMLMVLLFVVHRCSFNSADGPATS